jgi:hypothetical protein
MSLQHKSEALKLTEYEEIASLSVSQLELSPFIHSLALHSSKNLGLLYGTYEYIFLYIICLFISISSI